METDNYKEFETSSRSTTEKIKTVKKGREMITFKKKHKI